MRLSTPGSSNDLRNRAISLAIAFSLLLGLILTRIWFLQIWKGDEYRQFSDRNRFKIKRLAAPRGQIVDRHFQLLADNRPRFDVYYTRGYASDLEHELKVLSQIFQWSSDESAKRKSDVKSGSAYSEKRLARDISWDQLAQIQARALELNGVDIDVLAVRDYLYGDAFFHGIGYTGEINEVELERLSKRYPERKYRLGDEIGVIGAESFYEALLRGTEGRQFEVVDVKGRPVQRSGLNLFDQNLRVEPEAGKVLQLSIDLPLQLETIRAFGDEQGAAVAISPKTGEILALVSRPALDPNMFTKLVSSKFLQDLKNDPGQPFLDRTLAEHYPPGSTLKLVMATALLENQIVKPNTTYNCPGFFRYGRRVWRCHKRSGHGEVNLKKAVKESCDVYFYNAGLLLGLDAMSEWSKRFGLGRRTSLGQELFPRDGKVEKLKRFNSEQSGFIPDSKWVLEKGHTSIEGETINAGIGQGGYVTTIVQLARMVAAYASDSKLYQPQLVKSIRSPNGDTIQEFSAAIEAEIDLNPIMKNEVMSAMTAVVNEVDGTALGSRVSEFKFGGKTGTSQVVSLQHTEDKKDVARNLQDHALFVGLAPMEDPQIAVAVVVEHGGSGSRSAAPIAKAMVRNYLSRTLAKLNKNQVKDQKE